MGLYDTIRYEAVCPQCLEKIGDFQTKALGCNMKYYTNETPIKIADLEIERGRFEGYTHCTNCKSRIEVYFVINNYLICGKHIKTVRTPSTS